MILQRFSSVKLCLRSVRTVLYKENDLSTSTDRAGQYFKQAASLIFLPSGRLPSLQGSVHQQRAESSWQAEKCTQSLNSTKLENFVSSRRSSVGRALGTRCTITPRSVVRIPWRERCKIFLDFRNLRKLWGYEETSPHSNFPVKSPLENFQNLLAIQKSQKCTILSAVMLL